MENQYIIIHLITVPESVPIFIIICIKLYLKNKLFYFNIKIYKSVSVQTNNFKTLIIRGSLVQAQLGPQKKQSRGCFFYGPRPIC